MRKYKTINAPTVVETSITCNKCGKVYDLEEQDLEEWQAFFIHELTVRFGYASKFDGDTWNFDLCENCLEEMALSFIIPIESTGFYK